MLKYTKLLRINWARSLAPKQVLRSGRRGLHQTKQQLMRILQACAPFIYAHILLPHHIFHLLFFLFLSCFAQMCFFSWAKAKQNRKNTLKKCFGHFSALIPYYSNFISDTAERMSKKKGSKNNNNNLALMMQINKFTFRPWTLFNDGVAALLLLLLFQASFG